MVYPGLAARGTNAVIRVLSQSFSDTIMKMDANKGVQAIGAKARLSLTPDVRAN